METETRPRARRTRATVMFAELAGFTEMSEKLGVEAAYGAVTGVRQAPGRGRAQARRLRGQVPGRQPDRAVRLPGAERERPARGARGAPSRCGGTSTSSAIDLGVPLTSTSASTPDDGSGDIRGPVVREFHVLGDVVNVAARLNARAPRVRSTWVPRRGPRRRSLRVPCAAALRLKGKTKPVAAYELLEATAPRRGRRLGEEGAGTPGSDASGSWSGCASAVGSSTRGAAGSWC